jgi:hypothetical protein
MLKASNKYLNTFKILRDIMEKIIFYMILLIIIKYYTYMRDQVI